LLTQAEDIDARLTPLENRFSEQISACARAILYSLSLFLFSFAALLVAGGITFSLFFAGRISESESDLLASEESYRQPVAKPPDAILVHRQGTIIFANSALALLSGTLSTDELFGKQFLDSLDPSDRGTIEQKIQKYHSDPVHVLPVLCAIDYATSFTVWIHPDSI
jgi:PAS domain-containing protein